MGLLLTLNLDAEADGKLTKGSSHDGKAPAQPRDNRGNEQKQLREPTTQHVSTKSMHLHGNSRYLQDDEGHGGAREEEDSKCHHPVVAFGRAWNIQMLIVIPVSAPVIVWPRAVVDDADDR